MDYVTLWHDVRMILVVAPNLVRTKESSCAGRERETWTTWTTWTWDPEISWVCWFLKAVSMEKSKNHAAIPLMASRDEHIGWAPAQETSWGKRQKTSRKRPKSKGSKAEQKETPKETRPACHGSEVRLYVFCWVLCSLSFRVFCLLKFCSFLNNMGESKVLFFIHCVYVFLVIQNHFSRLELAEKKGSS